MRELDVSRLLALVVGATDGACTGTFGVHECLLLVVAHLEERASAWLDQHGVGAA